MPALPIQSTVAALTCEHLALDGIELDLEAIDNAVDAATWRELALLSLVRQHELTRELQRERATSARLRDELRRYTAAVVRPPQGRAA